jgi:chromate reductase
MDTVRLAVILGSTRPGRRGAGVAEWVLARAAARDDADAALLDLLDYALPVFDEPEPPMTGRFVQPHTAAWAEAIASYDAFVFVTPEYNRSIPGALKNAIDWGSRPWGQNSFARKPSAMIGTSPGMIGTAVGQQHLKSILSFCNSPQMNAIEAYIQFTPGLITDDGEVTVESTAEFLRTYMTEFHGFITRVYMALPRGGG